MQVGRHVELNDSEIDVGGNDTIYSSALRQLSAGASSASSAVVIPVSSASGVSAGSADPPSVDTKGKGSTEEEDCFFSCGSVAFFCKQSTLLFKLQTLNFKL